MIEFVNIFHIVPAQHRETVQFLAWAWLKTFGCKDELDVIFAEGVSPTGENPPTHYICSRKISTVTLALYMDEHKNRSSKAFEWVYPDLTLDKDIALRHFALMLMSKEEALEHLGLKPVGEI